jgi:hypothetical protein
MAPIELLEVKATTTPVGDQITVFLSRHEANVGAKRADWMLVMCHVEDIDTRHGRVLGWLPFELVKDQLPADSAAGRWEAASVRISLGEIFPGLPSAFV